MHPSPDAMQTFLRVAELSSFTRAAEHLGRPKASVSQAIQALEAELGTRLLHRTTRRVQLTQDGQLFYERCKDLLADMEELRGLFRQSPAQLSGRLRVDMPAGLARLRVLPRLPTFLQAHPGLSIEISSTDRRVDLVQEGFDCVLRIGTLEDSDLIARPLGQLSQINCASPAYLERHGRPQNLQDLSQHLLVHYLPNLGGKPVGWEWMEGPVLHRLPMKGLVTVNSTECYQAACLAGLGLIQAPAAGLRPLVEAGLLCEVLPDFCAPPLPVSLVYAHRRHLPRRVQAFMDWLAEQLAEGMEPLAPR
ncbi:MAG: LysR family transcriptional regulator [Curvibacter sp.]|nr:LysR family transcriptional regulator [Curvibacter sp.]